MDRTKMTPQQKRKATLIAKYGSEANWHSEMRKWRAMSTNSGKGGFYYLKHNDPAKLEEISKKGAHESRLSRQKIQPVDKDEG